MENEALEFIDKQVEESKTEMPSPERKEMDFDPEYKPQYDKSKYLVKETSTQGLGKSQDSHSYWDDERIKGAFNFGNGSWKDMKRYMDDNKGLAKFEVIRGEKPTSPTQNKTGNYYKLESPKITNTDAYLTAPVVKALEKGEGRSLENNELRSIVKGIADKNPNIKPKEFEKMLLNYKKPTSQPKSASYDPALGLTGNVDEISSVQKVVDDQLKKFGRIGGGMYDELDQKGYYLDENNKVRRKDEIRYDKIVYPKGTSKEYTEKVNAEYKKALPVLEKYGIKLEDFGGHTNNRGGYEDNSKEIMDKYVFEPFRKKYPNGNNAIWEREYKPLYEAIDAVLDKNYNDWWIRNK